MPMVWAASHCPRGTDRIAARITSAAYPPTLRLKAMMAAVNGLNVSPSDGRP